MHSKLETETVVSVLDLDWKLHPNGNHYSAFSKNGDIYIATNDGWRNTSTSKWNPTSSLYDAMNEANKINRLISEKSIS